MRILLATLTLFLPTSFLLSRANAGPISYFNDFNTTNSFHTDFQITYPSTNNNAALNSFRVALSQQTTSAIDPGLSNSTAISVVQPADTTAVLIKPSYRYNLTAQSNASPVILSVFFKEQSTGAAPFNQGSGIIQLGMLPTPTDSFNTGNAYPSGIGNTFISARVLYDGSLQFQTALGGAITNGLSSNPTSLIDGNWYFFTTSITLTNVNDNFTLSAALYNADSSRNIGPLLQSLPTTSIDFFNIQSAYAGFRVAGVINAYGVDIVDNFRIGPIPTPEPSSLLLATPLLLANRRRRNKRGRSCSVSTLE